MTPNTSHNTHQVTINSIAVHAYSIRLNLGNRSILQGLNASFTQSRWTSIVGPNGAGKSTLLKVLCGVLPCNAGRVDLLGLPLANWPRKERARSISWLGQSEAAGDDLVVYDVVMLARLPHLAWLAAPSACDHAAVEQALRETQAWDWRTRRLASLSGGERQRVLLARALAVQASIVLMDEPLTHLDPAHQADWLALVGRLTAQGTTVITVLHELQIALQADDMLIVANGTTHHMGACADPATHRALEAVFHQRIAVQPLAGQWVVLPR